jgi:hypothetical protein
MKDFPPNSDASKTEPRGEKKIERVTTSEARRRKKPLRRQFSETFMAGDPRAAMQYVLFDVMLPAAKDMIVDAGSSYIEKLIFGDKRRRGGSTVPQSGPMGYVSYHTKALTQGPPQPPRALSNRARARHDFDEIVLTSRAEAENVIDSLFDIMSQYERVHVADLYALVGFTSAHTDYKWGWLDLAGAGVSRVREGYLLDLPKPQPLD